MWTARRIVIASVTGVVIVAAICLTIFLTREKGSNHATLQFVDQKKYPDSKCMDGSPMAYWIKECDPRKWILYMEGATRKSCLYLSHVLSQH